MLTAIRERATGWIAWVIVTLLVIPFALWGINSYFEGGSEISVASVNGDDISIYTYQDDLSQQSRALSERLGSNFDPQLLETLGIRQRVLDNLINNRLLNQYTSDQNFRISDSQLSQMIQSEPAFQVDGKFDLAQYQAILSANRFSPQSFEQYQRVNEVVNQLSIGISDTAFVTDFDKSRLLALQDQQRTASYAVISTDQFIDQIEISDQEISQYYERNGERYMTEARIRVNYIELSNDALKELITLSEDQISSLYEETKGRYRTAENRRASHILISVPESAEEETRQEKLALANSLIERLNQGEDFSALAREFSNDPGSSSNGGDLGVIAREQMVKPFEDAVFSMQQGDINGPVQTQFGYHIIKLVELAPGQQQPLEEVRDLVAAEAKNIQAEDMFAELSESFKNLVFEDPDNLTTTADELDLPIKESDWFSLSVGQGVGAEILVRNAAFAEDVLTDNLVSPAIEIGFDKLIAIQKTEYEAETLKPLEEVKSDIVNSITRETVQAQVLEMGAQYLGEFDEGTRTWADWNAFISEKGLTGEQLTGKKQDVAPELALLANSIFSALTPESGIVTPGGVALANGDYALFILEQVTAGDPQNTDEAIAANVEARLDSRDGAEMYIQFRSHLRENADVTIYQDQL
jgi:peptidyl-prolyl cis-trans isomerase D